MALIGVMAASAALALPGLMAFARGQRANDAETFLQMEQALRSNQQRTDRQGRQVDELRERLEETQRQLDGVQLEMGDLRRGIAILLAQLERAGLAPEWTPPRRLQNGTTTSGLRKILRDGFNLEEMRDLSLDLGVPNEAIGATSPTAYARELVSYAERRGLLEELERRIQELRP